MPPMTETEYARLIERQPAGETAYMLMLRDERIRELDETIRSMIPPQRPFEVRVERIDGQTMALPGGAHQRALSWRTHTLLEAERLANNHNARHNHGDSLLKWTIVDNLTLTCTVGEYKYTLDRR